MSMKVMDLFHKSFRIYNKINPLRTYTYSVSRCYSSGSDEMFPGTGVEPTIPPYSEKQGEPIHMKKARLLYQSRKRGMLENGLLLSSFAHRHLSSLSEENLSHYDKLINQPTNDWEIYYWATGVRPTPEEFNSEVMDLLKDFVKNTERQSRIRQPDL